MKQIPLFLTLFLLLGYSKQGLSQYYTPSQISSIHLSKAAFEGDFYLDTINKNYYIGLTTGRLAKIGDTLDEIIDTVVYSGNKILLIEGIDTSILVMDSVISEEWKDNGSYIYAKRAKQSGKDFVFTDNGSFGVGTNTPSGFEGGTGKNTIHFTGNGGTEINLESKGGSSGYHPTLSFTYNGTRVGYIKMKKSFTHAIDGDMAFATHSGTSLTEKMRITKMGDIGIGTNQPLTKLHVRTSGTALPSSSGTTPSNGTIMRLETSSSNGVLDFGNFNSQNTTWIQSYNKGNMSSPWNLLINPNGGNVGIGITDALTKIDATNGTRSGTHNNANAEFYFSGNFGRISDGIEFVHNNGTAGVGVGWEGLYATGTNGNNMIRIRAQTGGAVLIEPDGGAMHYVARDDAFYPSQSGTKHLGLTTNRWNYVYTTNGVVQTSDKRLKKNILDLNYGLNEILKLRPVQFDWIDGSGKNKLGFIAQELKLIIPYVVSGDSETDFLGVNYSDLIPVLTKSIQEQQEIINELQKEKERQNKQIAENKKEIEKLRELIQGLK